MAQGPFVLLVEDDALLRGIIARNLQARGYIVLQAAGFREAIDRLAIKPSLAILDINLPDASGWEVADWLESMTADVPLLIISGLAPEPTQMARYHASAFLSKPFSIGELMALAQRYAPPSMARPEGAMPGSSHRI
jgi:DNA-binding response OmpR family regulator